MHNAEMMSENVSKENSDHYEYIFTVNIDPRYPQMRLSTMFQRLTEILQTGHVIEFTFSRTTLEEVFINFAKFQVNNDNQKPEATVNRNTLSQSGRAPKMSIAPGINGSERGYSEGAQLLEEP